MGSYTKNSQNKAIVYGEDLFGVIGVLCYDDDGKIPHGFANGYGIEQKDKRLLQLFANQMLETLKKDSTLWDQQLEQLWNQALTLTISPNQQLQKKHKRQQILDEIRQVSITSMRTAQFMLEDEQAEQVREPQQKLINEVSGNLSLVALSSWMRSSPHFEKRLRNYYEFCDEKTQNPYIKATLKVREEIGAISLWRCIFTFSFRETIYLKKYFNGMTKKIEGDITDEDRYQWQVISHDVKYHKTLEKLAKKAKKPIAQLNEKMQFTVAAVSEPIVLPISGEAAAAIDAINPASQAPSTIPEQQVPQIVEPAAIEAIAQQMLAEATLTAPIAVVPNAAQTKESLAVTVYKPRALPIGKPPKEFTGVTAMVDLPTNDQERAKASSLFWLRDAAEITAEKARVAVVPYQRFDLSEKQLDGRQPLQVLPTIPEQKAPEIVESATVEAIVQPEIVEKISVPVLPNQVTCYANPLVNPDIRDKDPAVSVASADLDEAHEKREGALKQREEQSMAMIQRDIGTLTSILLRPIPTQQQAGQSPFFAFLNKLLAVSETYGAWISLKNLPRILDQLSENSHLTLNKANPQQFNGEAEILNKCLDGCYKTMQRELQTKLSAFSPEKVKGLGWQKNILETLLSITLSLVRLQAHSVLEIEINKMMSEDFNKLVPLISSSLGEKELGLIEKLMSLDLPEILCIGYKSMLNILDNLANKREAQQYIAPLGTIRTIIFWLNNKYPPLQEAVRNEVPPTQESSLDDSFIAALERQDQQEGEAPLDDSFMAALERQEAVRNEVPPTQESSLDDSFIAALERQDQQEGEAPLDDSFMAALERQERVGTEPATQKGESSLEEGDSLFDDLRLADAEGLPTSQEEEKKEPPKEDKFAKQTKTTSGGSSIFNFFSRFTTTTKKEAPEPLPIPILVQQ